MSIREKNPLNTFEGKEAILNFLNPSNQPPTPLVEVTSLKPNLNADGKSDIHIFAKIVALSPLLNIKYLPVWNMLTAALEQGLLKGVHTIVEASSGNTGADLAIMAPMFGIKKVWVVVRRDTAPDKLGAISHLGATPTFPEPGETTVAAANRLGKQPGWLNINQYDHAANPEAIERWLAPEIWEQTGGELTVCASSLGTTGTILGCNGYFQRKWVHAEKSSRRPVQMVGGMCDAQENVPGARSRKRLSEIGLDWQRPGFHFEEDISAVSAYGTSLKLWQNGIVVGPSSGLALVALLRFLEKRQLAGTLDQLRNRSGAVVAVFICPDLPFQYFLKYATHLQLDGEWTI